MKRFISILVISLLCNQVSAQEEGPTTADVAACYLYLMETADPRLRLYYDMAMNAVTEKQFEDALKAEITIMNSVDRELYMVSAKQSCKALGINSVK